MARPTAARRGSRAGGRRLLPRGRPRPLADRAVARPRLALLAVLPTGPP